jgi:hypothetical protein
MFAIDSPIICIHIPYNARHFASPVFGRIFFTQVLFLFLLRYGQCPQTLPTAPGYAPLP